MDSVDPKESEQIDFARLLSCWGGRFFVLHHLPGFHCYIANLQLRNEKTDDSIKKQTKDQYTHFCPKKTYKQIISTASLAIRKVQMKTIMSWTPVIHS
jgi:hypothetical protein